MIDEREPWMREPTAEENPDALGILREEEEEPNFHALIEKARARADEPDCPDADLIRELCGMIEHLDNIRDELEGDLDYSPSLYP